MSFNVLNCGSYPVTPDGNTFTFQHGSTYGLTVDTQRVHYGFTVTA